MLYGLNTKQVKDMNEFHQRVADQNIQGMDDQQEEISQAKNSFIGMLGGILVGGVVGWLFLGPADNINSVPVIPVIRRPITPAKIQPNDPGGMEIDNQDREIYHIVDNMPKETKPVKIRPIPDMPKMVVENSISQAENMDDLVESIEENNNLHIPENSLKQADSVQVAHTELVGIKTNSNNKVIIPQKIDNIEVKLQKSIKGRAEKIIPSEKKIAQPIKVDKAPAKSVKGTWYAQIIASSSQKVVQTLWQKLSQKHQYLKQYPHEIEEITAANGNTLYRLKVGAFKTRKEAAALGDKMKKNQISSIIKQN